MDNNILQLIIRARDEASETLKSVGSTAKDVGNSLKESFGKAAIASGIALAGVSAEAFKMVSAFSEAETVEKQLDAALQSTKGIAGMTKDQILDLANGLSRFTAFDDEAILSAENLLLTFTAVGKDIFPQATQTILDMSQALGQDLKSSSIQLGKALQDPILGVTALRRVGVNFNEQQMETIKNMVETGHLLDAQKTILKELQTEFGGSAKAVGETFGGQLVILKTQIGNLEEAVGGMIAKALKPLVANLTPVISDFTAWVSGTSQLVDLQASLGNHLGQFGVIIGDVIGFLSQHKEVLIAVAGAIAGFLTIAIVGATVAMISFIGVSLPVIGVFMAIGAAVGLLIAYWPQISAFFNNLGNQISTTLINISNWWNTTWTNLTSFIQQALGFVDQLFSTIMGINIPFTVGFLIGYLMTAIPATIENIKSWFSQLPNHILSTWESVKVWTIQKVTEMIVWLTAQISALPGKIQTWINSIPGIVGNIFENAKQAAIQKMTEMFNGVMGWWDKIKGILDGIRDAANAAFDAVTRGINAGKQAGVRGFAMGGFVPTTGLVYLHQGEFVLSRDMLAGRQSLPDQINNNFSQPIVINAQIDSEVDIDLIGYKLAWYLRNAR